MGDGGLFEHDRGLRPLSGRAKHMARRKPESITR
jgi:hypothetical protein